MSLSNLKWAALLAVFAISQIGCYNSYTIDKTELSKLEASVDRYETVEVLADCPKTTESEDDEDPEGEAETGMLTGEAYAEADVVEPAGEEDVQMATDGRTKSVDQDDLRGCTMVPVSTVNPLNVMISDGSEQRVTPFNFVMDDVQLVSPEYDLLVQLDQVEGAKVREFSPWKTTGAIAGVTAVTAGLMTAVILIAPEEEGM